MLTDRSVRGTSRSSWDQPSLSFQHHFLPTFFPNGLPIFFPSSLSWSLSDLPGPSLWAPRSLPWFLSWLTSKRWRCPGEVASSLPHLPTSFSFTFYTSVFFSYSIFCLYIFFSHLVFRLFSSFYFQFTWLFHNPQFAPQLYSCSWGLHED